MEARLEPLPDHHYYFVTGKLAESAVRAVAESLAKRHGFRYTIGVMPITVAALMTPRWIGCHLQIPSDVTHIIVPGYCEVGLEELSAAQGVPVISGPKDCRALPELFGGPPVADDFGDHNIEIIAEINHATRQSVDSIVADAKRLKESGADVIDFGCDPSNRCKHIGEYITALVDAGLRVSVDTFDIWEAQEATKRGASLVLSVNSQNRHAARDWGTEVVAIPDTPTSETSLRETVEYLTTHDVPHRLDPILEPIGAGFMNSLMRYARVRQEYPEHAMMMGIGNLTELTDVDSAGVNVLLLGICQELEIHSILTTQVINWARTSVQECDHARRLTHYSVKHGVPPKRLSKELVLLRDAKLLPYPKQTVDDLAESIRDNNYRILAQNEVIHLLSANLHLQGDDPFRLFDQLMDEEASDNVDPGHAFYLGYEMAKAAIALQLGKQYEQDESLDWGFLTKTEDHHRIARKSRHREK